MPIHRRFALGTAFAAACAAPQASDGGTSTTTDPVAQSTGTAFATTSTDTTAAPPGVPMPLIDHAAWVDSAASDDPLAEHRPAQIECGIAGWLLESAGTILEMDTGSCNYLSIEQPTLLPIEEGRELSFEMWHFDLTAPESAEAHIALIVGDTIAWERTIPIPGGPGGAAPAEVWNEAFPSEFSAPAGTPLRLHVHNHGQNTWNLSGIWVESPL